MAVSDATSEIRLPVSVTGVSCVFVLVPVGVGHREKPVPQGDFVRIVQAFVRVRQGVPGGYDDNNRGAVGGASRVIACDGLQSGSA